MDQSQKNKEFIINYLGEVSGVAKTREMMENYMTDESLIGHIEFFEKAFPCYNLYIDEITSEGNRVIIKARCNSEHRGYLGEIAPTYKQVDFPCVVGYEIENEKIVSHWMIADQMTLMQQLGIVPGTAAH